MKEPCVLCGADAAVRVAGTSYCSACGLDHHSSATASPARSRRRATRAAFFALLSSGLVVKALLGAVALAAVGGAVASTVFNGGEPVAGPAAVAAVAETTPQSTSEAPATSPPAIPSTVSTTTSPAVELGAVTDYAVAIQGWADCVSAAASEHSGGPFDPRAACGDKPSAADFGIPVELPGHDDEGPGKSEDAPGRNKDK